MSTMMFGHSDLGIRLRSIMIGFEKRMWEPLNWNADAVLRLVWGNPWRVVNSNFWGGTIENFSPKIWKSVGYGFKDNFLYE